MVDTEPSFLVELLRKHAWGPVLQAVGFVGLAIVGFRFNPTIATSPFLKLVLFIALVSLASGMFLTNKHASNIQRDRRARAPARSPSPWRPTSES